METQGQSATGEHTAVTSFIDVSTGQVSLCAVLQPDGASRAERLAMLGLMSAGVVHDIGNALGAIAAGVTLLERRLDEDAAPELRLLVQEIMAATHRTGAICGQVRRHLRPGAVPPAAIEVGGLIRALSPMIGWAAGPLIDVRILDQAPGAKVRCCGVMLERVVINLVVNARQAMASGGRLDIELLGPAAIGEGRAMLRVRDTGCGLTPEDLRRRFDPAFATRDKAATGLGLSVVEAFVHELGGRLEVDSAPGEGTAISLILPTDDEGA